MKLSENIVFTQFVWPRRGRVKIAWPNTAQERKSLQKKMVSMTQYSKINHLVRKKINCIELH